MKKVLVSGAGGFVGARIMTQLADRYELCSFPKGMLAAANETAVQEHICRTQPDVILHTAAISDTGYSEKHPEECFALALDGTGGKTRRGKADML